MNNYSVLIVEDERIVAKDIQTTLQKQGYRVVGIAPSSEKAIELIEQDLPDIVLMDIMIEGDIDGIDTAKIIQDSYDVPIVFLTAFSNVATIERAKLSNPYGYILKPFQEREIQIVIEMAVYKHQTEKKLRENKEFISAIVDTIGDGVIATNSDGIITYMNVFAEKIIGCVASECIGKHYKDVFVLVGNDLWTSEVQLEFLRQSIRNEFPAQVWLQNNKNQNIPIEGSISRIENTSPHLYGEVIAFRDISDRKAVQESLIDSEMRFRLIAENSQDLILLMQSNGEISYASPSHSTVLGLNAHSIEKSTIYRILFPEDEEILRNAIDSVFLDNLNFTIDIKLKMADGSYIDVETKISRINFKGQNTILLVSRDISARKKTEKILIESEERYRTMVECLNEGIVITDLEDTILFVNTKTSLLLEKNIEHLIGYKAHQVIIPNGEYNKDVASKLQQRKLGASERYSEVIYLSNGKERYLEVSAAPFKNAEGVVVGTVGAIYDITDQMRAQTEVVASKEKFENLVLNAPVGIIRWLVKDRKYEFANKEFERQSSMKLDEFALLSHEDRINLIHPEDREMAVELATRWIESGAYSPEVVQYRTFDKAGNVRWSNTYIYAERNASTSELESITQLSVDITELKAIQEALSKAQKEDFKRTVKNLQNLVIKMYRREDGEFAYSLREGKLAGELTTDVVFGKSPKNLFEGDYETKTLPYVQRTFAGESVAFESELPDGRFFYFTLEPLFENGVVHEIVGSAVDITNQKIISNELHESENKFKILTDAIPIGITQISHLPDNVNIVDYVNPEFVRQSGYTFDEFIEKSKVEEWSFIHPDDREDTMKAFHHWYSTNRHEPFRTQYRFLRNDGAYIWLEVYLTHYEKADGTVVGIQSGVDISQKKIAEQRLLHLAAFPEQIPQPIIELRDDGTVTYINPEAKNYFPKIIEKGLDHSILTDLTEKLKALKEGKLTSFTREVLFESWYFEERVFYISGSNTFRVFLYDITDRKRNETELQKTLDKERELYSLKSRFLTTVSHEFRTPLTGIQISAEILSSHANKMDFNQRMSEIEKIKDRVHDLTMLMNDFSMQSTIDSIGEYFHPTKIQFTELAKMLQSDANNFVLGKSQTLIFTLDPELPNIFGDERMLRQAVANIILNASKYSAKEKVIRVAIDVHSTDTISIKVTDKGIGIPEEDIKTIFTPFSRATNIGTQPGIGLGLSISKDIIEFHGGTIEVESEIHIGSTFTIVLPVILKAKNNLSIFKQK